MEIQTKLNYEVTYNALKEMDTIDTYHTVIRFLEIKIKKAICMIDWSKYNLEIFYNKEWNPKWYAKIINME